MPESRAEPPAAAAPLVSVVMPVHNGETYLCEAVESIRRQCHAPTEIIVVDDGSTDRSAAIAEGLGGGDVRLVRQPHRGLPAAHNQGLAAARGDFIAFLDCDDLWTKEKLTTQLAVLREHPDIEIVLGHTRRMWTSQADDDDAPRRHLSEPVLALSLGAALVRRSAFDRVGAFDEAISHSDDWDWFMRVRELGALVVVHPDVTLLYRRHGGNMTNQVPENMASFTKMLQKSLARRRSCGPAASLPDLLSLDQYLRQRERAMHPGTAATEGR